MKTFRELLIELKACKEAVAWARDKTIDEVVEQCHRGDWLLWLAARVDIGLQPLTLAKGHCANTVRHLMKDERSRRAVDVAIAFGEGRATRDELKNADADATSSYVDATSSYVDATAYAAYAVAYYAVDATSSWAAATSSASWAAYAYAYASAARKENQELTADICRKYIGELIVEKVNENLK